MSSSAYWNSEMNRLMNNPPSSSNYYNQSFVDKINEAQASIDNLVAEKDKAWSASQQKMDEYDTFRGSMKAYGDVWKSSEDEFGVKQAQDNYESSKKALAMTQTTLEALPSSINAASNRVMTQSQREQAYNILADRVNRNMAMNERSVSTYEEAWKNARENQAAKAEAEMAFQRSTLAEYGNMWNEATNKFNQIGENLISAKGYKSDWENQYRTWQNQQYNNALTVWQNELDSATTRYIQAVKNEIAERKAEQVTSSVGKILEFDFGNGYTARGSSGKNAIYYRNGKEISAGQFLEGTGAYGANWNMWNNMWNSGVQTYGVGSDTVEAFNRRSAVGYGYLFS